MKKFVPLFLAAALALPLFAYAQVVPAGSVDEGGYCYSSDPDSGNSDCAGNLACINNRCAVDSQLDNPGFGTQSGAVAPGGACAYNADCADQGSTLYECINSVCTADQGTVSSGGTCTGNDDCAGELACISGICQVDTQLNDPYGIYGQGGTGLNGATGGGTTGIPGATGSGATGATTGGGLPAPNIAYAQSYVITIIGFINGLLVPLLIAVAFIVFLWGVANAYILHPGDEEAVKKGHQYILWGIIGFVVIFSVWGLVNLVGSTLGLGAGSGHPPYPTL